MEKGRILYLNGVTSSGKTSIVEALQARRDVFFYVVANDLFQEMIGEEYLQEDYWKYLGEVIIMMYHTAKLFSDMGKNVIIDSILVERDGDGAGDSVQLPGGHRQTLAGRMCRRHSQSPVLKRKTHKTKKESNTDDSHTVFQS